MYPSIAAWMAAAATAASSLIAPAQIAQAQPASPARPAVVATAAGPAYNAANVRKASRQVHAQLAREFARMGKRWVNPSVTYSARYLNTPCGPTSTAVTCLGGKQARIYVTGAQMRKIANRYNKRARTGWLVLYHEEGHAIQVQLHGPKWRPRTRQAALRAELGAHCYAGWLMRVNGWSKADVNAVLSYKGIPSQWVKADRTGYHGSINTCHRTYA